eukprot:2685132-Pleurochrysis_carterae.AAC.2
MNAARQQLLNVAVPVAGSSTGYRHWLINATTIPACGRPQFDYSEVVSTGDAHTEVSTVSASFTLSAFDRHSMATRDAECST